MQTETWRTTRAKQIYRYDVTISVDVTAESEEEAERLLHEGFRNGAFDPNEDEFALQKETDQ